LAAGAFKQTAIRACHVEWTCDFARDHPLSRNAGDLQKADRPQEAACLLSAPRGAWDSRLDLPPHWRAS
jgi:hypothetical protein